MRAKEKTYLEYVGGQIPVSDIAAAIKKTLAKDVDLDVKEVRIYIQPETNMVYYTVNGESRDEWCAPLDSFFAKG